MYQLVASSESQDLWEALGNYFLNDSASQSPFYSREPTAFNNSYHSPNWVTFLPSDPFISLDFQLILLLTRPRNFQGGGTILETCISAQPDLLPRAVTACSAKGNMLTLVPVNESKSSWDTGGASAACPAWHALQSAPKVTGTAFLLKCRAFPQELN